MDTRLNLENERLDIFNQFRKNIQEKLLDSKNPQENNRYYVFIPKQTEKNVTLGERAAIDLVVSHKLENILIAAIKALENLEEYIYPLIKEQKKLNPLISVSLDLRKKFLELIEKEAFSLKDLQNILIENGKNTARWIKTIEGLQEVFEFIKKEKKSDESLSLYCEELKVILEGLYLYFCVQNKRDEIKKDIFNEHDEKKLTSHPDKEKKVMIFLNVKMALDKIAYMETEESFPIMLAILDEMAKKENQSLQTKDAIAYGIKILSDADQVQYKPKDEIKNYLKNKKNEILPDLQRLVDQIKNIEINESIFSLCEELAIWLEGLYLHTYNQNGFTRGVKDGALRLVTGNPELSLLKIAKYYSDAAKELQLLFNAYKEKLELSSSEKQANNSEEIKCSSKSELNQSQDSNENVVIPTSGKKITGITFEEEMTTSGRNLIIGLPEEGAFLIPEIKNFIMQRLNNKQESIYSGNNNNNVTMPTVQPNFSVNEEEFGCLLEIAQKNINDEAKIMALYAALVKFDLSENQKAVLNDLSEKGKTFFEGYKSNTYFRSILGDFYSQKLFPRAHTEVADKGIEELKSQDDPKGVIAHLFSMRLILSPKKSHDLLDSVNKLLVETYDKLYKLYQSQLKNQQTLPRLKQLPYMQTQTLYSASPVIDPLLLQANPQVCPQPGNNNGSFSLSPKKE